MNSTELTKKHELHTRLGYDWDFYELAYDGGRPFIAKSLHKHDRESDNNWRERVQEGICLNYCKATVDLFNFYLTEKPASRQLGILENDVQWQSFFTDCDMMGTNFELYLKEMQKIASIFGAVGILVDKSKAEFTNKAEEIDNNVYPYCAYYTLPNILDWKYSRNIANKPVLTYLKLKESDSVYTIWTSDTWERWEIPSQKDKSKPEPVMIESGINKLKEIPFIWMTNQRRMGKYPYIGVSDIIEVSLITASIIRNVSCGDEVIKFAGFPMMRKPMESDNTGTTEDIVGVRGVLEFDSSQGEAGKPDWLESAIQEPIVAILDWVDRKVDELYRICHLSGVHGQRKSNNEVSSGIAIRYEFQQLNAVLIQKSANMTEAELLILNYWLKWQKLDDLFKKTKISRDNNFSIDDLTISLENSFKAIDQIPSNKFGLLLRQYIVKQMLPNMTDADYTEISEELVKNRGNKSKKIIPESSVPSAVDYLKQSRSSRISRHFPVILIEKNSFTKFYIM